MVYTFCMTAMAINHPELLPEQAREIGKAADENLLSMIRTAAAHKLGDMARKNESLLVPVISDGSDPAPLMITIDDSTIMPAFTTPDTARDMEGNAPDSVIELGHKGQLLMVHIAVGGILQSVLEGDVPAVAVDMYSYKGTVFFIDEDVARMAIYG